MRCVRHLVRVDAVRNDAHDGVDVVGQLGERFRGHHHAGADCHTIAGWDWNPGHVRGETTTWRGSDPFDGEASALLVMRMASGSFASYEGNNLEASSMGR